MTKTLIAEEQYKILAGIAKTTGCRARPDYSGRGMYGATCFGVTGTPRGLTAWVVEACAALPELKEAFISGTSRDSMGLDEIHYWRGIQVEGHARDSKWV